ncbi:MAG: ABC transporter permease [Lentisphaeria bacterium]|nr:ABC transporter permease [Lentisphaeria bacterium]
MMLVSDIIELSLQNLRLHKTRSILTSLGVIFGVGSVIAMLSISEGAKRSALSQIEAMGIDKIIVYSKKPPVAGGAVSTGRTSMVERYGLTLRDRKHLLDLDNVERITALRDARKRVMKGQERLDLKLVGADRHFLADSASTLVQGRWFGSWDFQHPVNVCVIGSNVKRKLFRLGDKEVIGSNIRVETLVLKVIGVLENDNGTNYPELGSPNDMILIPSSTSAALFGNYAYSTESGGVKVTLVDYDVLLVKVAELEHIGNTAKRIGNYLEKTHAKVKDWDLVVPLDLLKQREATQNIFTIVMSSIAGISLIVGGIGIMNIMLASVFERRKEIGTRRALGAQKSDILFQFLIETVVLTTSGGILGILLGVGISQIITMYANMPTVYSWWSMAASLLISSLVGVIFGTYPAWQAAQQNPITVLRAE